MLHMYNPYKRLTRRNFGSKMLGKLFSSSFTDGHGYPGDEDNGQTSAWYVMNAIGFYSASPGIAEYSLSSGIIDSLRNQFEDGKTFTFENQNQSPEKHFTSEASLNGEDHMSNIPTHADIMSFKLVSEKTDFASAVDEQGHP